MEFVEHILTARYSALGAVILDFNPILLTSHFATFFSFFYLDFSYLIDIETEQKGRRLLIPGHPVTGRTETSVQVPTLHLNCTMIEPPSTLN